MPVQRCSCLKKYVDSCFTQIQAASGGGSHLNVRAGCPETRMHVLSEGLQQVLLLELNELLLDDVSAHRHISRAHPALQLKK
jgi:hypothetical protein